MKSQRRSVAMQISDLYTGEKHILMGKKEKMKQKQKQKNRLNCTEKQIV